MPDGKVIACLNFKGGVGKTTIATHIAGGLQRFCKKDVLLIDLDPQFNATQLLFADKFVKSRQSAGKSTQRLFLKNAAQVPAAFFSREGAADPKMLISVYAHENAEPDCPPLHVIAGSFDLMKVALSNSRIDRQSSSSLMFREFVRHCRRTYDYVVLDLNPGGSILTYYALDVADQMLCPLTGDLFSYMGLELIVDFMDDFLPGKADETFFTLIENCVSSEQEEARKNDGTESQIRYQVSRKPMLKNCIIDEAVPESKFLASAIGGIKKGLFFDRTPAQADELEHAALIETFRLIASSVVKNASRAD